MMGRILRIPAVAVSVTSTDNRKEYMLSSEASLIDINDITIMEIYDEHTGITINKYITSRSCDHYSKCEECAFCIYKKDRISGVCTRSRVCRGNDLIFLSADKLLEGL
jgi:hypothetical protein